jgi:hypothetical protein
MERFLKITCGHDICREVLLGNENCEDYITQPYWQQVYEWLHHLLCWARLSSNNPKQSYNRSLSKDGKSQPQNAFIRGKHMLCLCIHWYVTLLHWNIKPYRLSSILFIYYKLWLSVQKFLVTPLIQNPGSVPAVSMGPIAIVMWKHQEHTPRFVSAIVCTN